MPVLAPPKTERNAGQPREVVREEGLFRAEALAHLAAPDQIEVLMRVISPCGWIPLIALGAIIGLALVWVCFGRIPMTVPGRGVLIRPGKVSSLQAAAAGQLQSLGIHEGDFVRKGMVIGVIDQAGLRQQIELERSRLARQEAENATLLAFQETRQALEKQTRALRRTDLQERIRDTQALAEHLRQVTRESIREQRGDLTKALELSKELTRLQKERLAADQKLLRARALSRDESRKTEESYLQVVSKELDLQTQLQQLELRAEQVEDAYLEKMDRVSLMKSQVNETLVEEKTIEQKTLELTTTQKLAVAEIRRGIARLELALEKQGKVLSEASGRVVEITVSVGQVVNPGMKIATVLDENPSSPLVCLGYFRVKEGKRVGPSMKARIAPDPVQRERFGSMLSRVHSVTPFPVSKEAATNTIGNSEVARLVIGDDRQIEVLLDLQANPATPSGYAWTSSRGPRSPVTGGTTVNVEIEVESRAPISFLLPFIREWTEAL